MTISFSIGRRRRDWYPAGYGESGGWEPSYWSYYAWWRPNVWFYPADMDSHWGAGVGWLWFLLRAGGGV